MFRTVSVIGGDLRQLTLAGLLAKDGYDVIIYGFDKDIDTGILEHAKTLEEALDADIVILPVPVSFDGKTVNMPFSENKLTIAGLVTGINPLSAVFGGKISGALSAAFTSRAILHRDYMTRDELAIRNAVPTAEGAIEIAIAETPITLHGSKCLVMGYGKVGKVLSHTLCAMGAETYVEARKFADLALIESHGCRPLTMNEAKLRLCEFDVIFNTIPALVLTKDMLVRADRRSLIIDLASKPGGVDLSSASELGIKVIWALSLPGKVAPVTAGMIIKDTITNMIEELGI